MMVGIKYRAFQCGRLACRRKFATYCYYDYNHDPPAAKHTNGFLVLCPVCRHPVNMDHEIPMWIYRLDCRMKEIKGELGLWN